jgi:hypothetical protein
MVPFNRSAAVSSSTSQLGWRPKMSRRRRDIGALRLMTTGLGQMEKLTHYRRVQ